MNWVHFALGIVVTVLQAAIKNPASIAKEKAVLLEVRDLINAIFPNE